MCPVCSWWGCLGVGEGGWFGRVEPEGQPIALFVQSTSAMPVVVVFEEMQKSVAWRQCDCAKHYKCLKQSRAKSLLSLIFSTITSPYRPYRGIWWFVTSSWTMEGNMCALLTPMSRACPPLPSWSSKVREPIHFKNSLLYASAWMHIYCKTMWHWSICTSIQGERSLTEKDVSNPRGFL